MQQVGQLSLGVAGLLIGALGQLACCVLQGLAQGLLLRQVEAARERDRLATEAEGDGHGVLSQSRAPSVRALADRARRVADTDTAVLILGETGTGKERLARAVHDWSQRASGPFVAINCAAILLLISSRPTASSSLAILKHWLKHAVKRLNTCACCAVVIRQFIT